MNSDGGRLGRKQKLIRGIDGIVAELLAARVAAESDDMAGADEAFGRAVEETAALAKDLRS